LRIADLGKHRAQSIEHGVKRDGELNAEFFCAGGQRAKQAKLAQPPKQTLGMEQKNCGLWIADLGKHRAQSIEHGVKRDGDLNAEFGPGNLEFFLC